MKQFQTLLLATLVALFATACKEKPSGLLDKGAMIYINVTKLKSADMEETEGNLRGTIDGKYMGEYRDTPRTPREIVQQAGGFVFTHPDGQQNANIGISDVQRDLENERIKMWGEQVINKDGTLNDYFIQLRDIRLGGYSIDPEKMEGKEVEEILAYIPNAVMVKAEQEIRKAYAEGNYTKVYELFHKAYTAIPITNKAWEKLKAEGKN